MRCVVTRTGKSVALPANCVKRYARRWRSPSIRTTRYDIDLFKCIYCGFCEESCPVDSIVETHILEYHFEKRGENIVTKPQLLAIGDRLESEIAERRAADAAYR